MKDAFVGLLGVGSLVLLGLSVWLGVWWFFKTHLVVRRISSLGELDADSYTIIGKWSDQGPWLIERSRGWPAQTSEGTKFYLKCPEAARLIGEHQDFHIDENGRVIHEGY